MHPKEYFKFHPIGKSPATNVVKAFLAFSLGKHACPSRYFAAIEIKTALHCLILKYNIKNLDGKKVYPQIKGPFRFSSHESLVLEKKKTKCN
ncbi:5735_t:CDS:2 [Funneliformis geosporum]|nr:5735_t:CDS:2 [Funneliformis geosporum]